MFLYESEATATEDFCAKAKRQQQMIFVRKRIDSQQAARGRGLQSLRVQARCEPSSSACRVQTGANALFLIQLKRTVSRGSI